MPHALSPADREMADLTVQELGVPGHYSDEVLGQIDLNIQWIGGYNEIGTDGNGRPWESMVLAYVSAGDVPFPKQGAIVWLDESPDTRYMIERFNPTGGLWELELFGE